MKERGFYFKLAALPMLTFEVTTLRSSFDKTEFRLMPHSPGCDERIKIRNLCRIRYRVMKFRGATGLQI